jgi:hypothetical protein
MENKSFYLWKCSEILDGQLNWETKNQYLELLTNLSTNNSRYFGIF